MVERTMTIGQGTLDVIKEYAIHMDWDVAFDGKSKGNHHLHRVNKIVTHLAKNEKARMDICIAGGWLHDLGLVKGNKHHCFTGAKLAEEYLTDLGLDSKDIGHVAHCIEAHDGEINAKTLEAMVVHDADTIDKMGIFGFIRHVWKISLIEDLSADQLIDFVAKHLDERKLRLYLPVSREIAKDLHDTLVNFLEDKKATGMVVATVMDFASQGLPSERVAETVLEERKLKEDFRQAIECQMATCYLHQS
jgi:hypothetical protein